MTATLTRPGTGREAARLFGAYAKDYSAGAFATPTAAELDRMLADGGLHWWEPGVVAASRRLTRDSQRHDFAGRPYLLRGGARIITHLAAAADAPLPNLDHFDWIFAYVEDANLTTQLRGQGREVRAVRISASSEIIACWGRAGTAAPYDPVDRATLTQVPLDVPDQVWAQAKAEASGMTGWTDDFPFYSDGSWDAVSLRGFNPADPTWGIKPAEMSKAWWADHPEAAQYDRCDWTVLAAKTPALVRVVEGLGWGQLERVRLLRMAGRGGKGGRLLRHTDITDRAAGTSNGMIVRFHIPVTTHPKITMSGWNLDGRRADIHLPERTQWYLDARKPHAVDNRAGIDRIHLVVDVLADTRTRAAIEAGKDHAA